MARSTPASPSKRFAALNSVDKVVHEPARLMILGILNLVEEADFLFLLNQTSMTRGNLSTHLRKLEDTGYVTIRKEFINRIPHTVLAITKAGTHALSVYRKAMTGVIDSLSSSAT